MKNKIKSVLIVVAHTDDKTPGCGGIIIRLKLANYEIYDVTRMLDMNSINYSNTFIENKYLKFNLGKQS